MRCRNCHTALMATDTHCPSCRASVGSATAAAPGPINKPSPLLMMLPIFGGALGGVAYAALTIPGAVESSRSSADSAKARSSLRRIFAGALILVGALFLWIAYANFSDTLRISRAEPKEVTAVQLLEKKTIDSSWMSYTFKEAKPTGVTVKRRRLGYGGDVQASCLLVRVEDKWLVATVAPGFEGDRLVGRLAPLDKSLTASLQEQLPKVDVKPSSLLSFEFKGVDGTASDQQLRYSAAAGIAVFGIVGLLLGMLLLRRRRRGPQADAAVENDWTFHPVPTRN